MSAEAPSSNGAGANGAGPSAEQPLRLGGMALRNGLLIHGPTSWAVAARAADGTIEVASGPKPTPRPRAGSRRCRCCAARCASPRRSR